MNPYPFQNRSEAGRAESGDDIAASESDDESVKGFGTPGGSAPASPTASDRGGCTAEDVYAVDGHGDAGGDRWVPEEMAVFVSFDGSDPESASTAHKIITTLRPKPFCTVVASDQADTYKSDMYAATGASIVRSTCMVVVLSQPYLASKLRMAELSLAYTANLAIYCISTVPYDQLGHVSFYMRLTLGVVEWLHADAEHYEESVGKLLDAVVHAPEAVRNCKSMFRNALPPPQTRLRSSRFVCIFGGDLCPLTSACLLQSRVACSRLCLASPSPPRCRSP